MHRWKTLLSIHLPNKVCEKNLDKGILFRVRIIIILLLLSYTV